MIKEQIFKIAIERGMTYDPITGNIYGKSGKIITRKIKTDYICPKIYIDGKDYTIRGHIFAWYYIYGKIPENQIDHINNIRDDNRIINLRDVTPQQNQFNRKVSGVTQRKNGKWTARIGVNYKRINLGNFDTKQEAEEAYLDAKKIYHKI